MRSMMGQPRGRPVKIPQIQYAFPKKSALSNEMQRLVRERKSAIKKVFERSWQGYRNHAWLRDELAPLSGTSRNHYGGWAGTLVDSLDTLWIMGLREEFEEAVQSVETIDFTTTDQDEINTFETTIRYLGGLLAAYDISSGQYPSLLEKAVELGKCLEEYPCYCVYVHGWDYTVGEVLLLIT